MMPRSVLALRNLERALPYSLHQLIRKLTVPSRKFPARIIGSQRYLAHKYPADLDVVQSFPKLRPNHIAHIVQALAKSRKYIVLTDFKMGHDERFLVRGLACKQKPMDVALARRDVARVVREGLLDRSQASQWTRLARRLCESCSSRRELLDLVREKFVLRWTLPELERGYKILPKEKTITIGEALRKNPFVKIDVIIRTRGRFVECSFILGEMFWFRNSYKREIATQVEFNISKGRWMKAAKRAWLLGIVDQDRVAENIKFLKKLAPLFGSRAAQLYQHHAEADSIRMLARMYPRGALKNLTPVLKRMPRGPTTRLSHINKLAKVYLEETGTMDRMLEMIHRIPKRKCLTAKEELMLPPT